MPREFVCFSISGSHQIDVLYEGTPIAGSPFTSRAFDVSAINVSAIQNGITGRPVEFTSEFVIRLTLKIFWRPWGLEMWPRPCKVFHDLYPCLTLQRKDPPVMSLTFTWLSLWTTLNDVLAIYLLSTSHILLWIWPWNDLFPLQLMSPKLVKVS